MKDCRCDDKDMLVAFLYGELAPDEHRVVEAHLETCSACTDEVAGLTGVRHELAGWLPPEPELGFTIVQKPAALIRPPRWWTTPIPVWAQAAAAVLVLAAGATIANVQVRYDASGVIVSTGWMSAAAAGPASSDAARTSVPTGAPAETEWRTALASLESDMRREMQALRLAGASAPASIAGATASDAALLKRVQGLIDESERRQRQELALRITQMDRDFEVQRRADLLRIEQGVGQLQGRTGAEQARQRELLNYLVRVSSRPVVPE